MAWFFRLLHCFGSSSDTPALASSAPASATPASASKDLLTPPVVWEAKRDGQLCSGFPTEQQGLAACLYLAQESPSEGLHKLARLSAGAAGLQSHPIHSFMPSPAPHPKQQPGTSIIPDASPNVSISTTTVAAAPAAAQVNVRDSRLEPQQAQQLALLQQRLAEHREAEAQIQRQLDALQHTSVPPAPTAVPGHGPQQQQQAPVCDSQPAAASSSSGPRPAQLTAGSDHTAPPETPCMAAPPSALTEGEEGLTPAWKGQLSFTSHTPGSWPECATPELSQKSFPRAAADAAIFSFHYTPGQSTCMAPAADAPTAEDASPATATTPDSQEQTSGCDISMLASPVGGVCGAPLLPKAAVNEEDVQLRPHDTPFAVRIEREMQKEEDRQSQAVPHPAAQQPHAKMSRPPLVARTPLSAASLGGSNQPRSTNSRRSTSVGCLMGMQPPTTEPGREGSIISAKPAVQLPHMRSSDKENQSDLQRLSFDAFAPSSHMLARTPLTKTAGPAAMPAATWSAAMTPALKSMNNSASASICHTPVALAGRNSSLAMQTPAAKPAGTSSSSQSAAAAQGNCTTPAACALQPPGAASRSAGISQGSTCGKFQTPSSLGEPQFVWETSTSEALTPHIAGIDNPVTNYRENKRLRCHDTPFETRVDRFMEAEQHAYMAKLALRAGQHDQETS